MQVTVPGAGYTCLCEAYVLDGEANDKNGQNCSSRSCCSVSGSRTSPLGYMVGLHSLVFLCLGETVWPVLTSRCER